MTTIDKADLDEATFRRRVEILAEFAQWLPGLAHGEIAIRVRNPRKPLCAAIAAPSKPPTDLDRRREQAIRQLRLAATTTSPIEITPLPREACPVCGMTYGSINALAAHRRRIRH